MFKIGNVEINGKVALAPMAGITSYGYRKFFEDFDIAFSYTEMVSDMGLIYQNKETMSYIEFTDQNKPVGVQLFGNNPDTITKAALIVKNKCPNISFIDVNMACPVQKVTKAGSGSALLKDPKKCGEIIRNIKSATGLPVSAKIRLGWDDKSLNFMEIIHELEDAGVSFIAVHARTAKQLYLGEPNFELIRDLQGKMKVPLLISGNIYTPQDAKKAMEITGAKGVLLARGGMGNPFLANQIEQYLNTGTIPSNPNSEIDECLKLARDIIEEKGEERGIRIYRTIAPKFIRNTKNAKLFRGKLASELVDYKSLENILEEYRLSLLEE